MNLKLQAALDPRTGVFTRTQVLGAGYTDRDIETMVKTKKAWHRLRQGVYIENKRWNSLDDVARHRVMAYAVSLRCGHDLVFSHVTAAVLLDWPVWGIDLDTVRVTRRKGHSGRLEAGVHHVEAPMPDDQVVVVDGLRVTSAERTMADAAREYGHEEAVVLCDAALRGGADRKLALTLLDERYTWSKTRQARFPVVFADGRAANPAESRLRLSLHLQGLPDPEPQGAICDHNGEVFAYGDLVYREQRVVVEFDGKLKYGIELDGQDPRERLFREKLREDRVREAGYEVVRVTWCDLLNPAQLAARIRAAFARAAARFGRPA